MSPLSLSLSQFTAYSLFYPTAFLALHTGIYCTSIIAHHFTVDIHKELEQKIASFHGTEDTILYGSCFDANGGLFEVCVAALSLFLCFRGMYTEPIDYVTGSLGP